MTVNADCTLFPSGRRAAEHISRVLNDHGPSAARKTAQNEYGWEPLGQGISRVAFQSQDSAEQVAFEVTPNATDQQYIEDSDRCVIKVGIPGSGQMVEEIRQWRLISGEKASDEPWEELKPVVAPVKDWDRDNYRWLTMPLGNTRDVDAGDVSEVVDYAEKQGFMAADIHDGNIALFDGQPKIIDFGHDFKYTGYTEAERWTEYEERLERMGCRDVYSEPKRRQFWEFYWRHPLRLPGLPYESEPSHTMFTKGADLKEMELYGSVIPKEVAERITVENVLDEVINVEEAWRGMRTFVTEYGEGFVPGVSASHAGRAGPNLDEVEPFLEVFYDRYDAAFAKVVPEDYEYETAGSPASPPTGTPVLEQIEQEFQNL